MSDLIRREDAIKAMATWDWQDLYLPIHFQQLLEELPSAVCDDCIWHVCNYNKVDWDADVVSKGVFDQVKWERDTALKTLEEHGIGFGERADRPTGRWKMMMNSIEYWYECSECGGKPLLNRFSKGEEHSPFCPSCGAEMNGGEEE